MERGGDRGVGSGESVNASRHVRRGDGPHNTSPISLLHAGARARGAADGSGVVAFRRTGAARRPSRSRQRLHEGGHLYSSLN